MSEHPDLQTVFPLENIVDVVTEKRVNEFGTNPSGPMRLNRRFAADMERQNVLRVCSDAVLVLQESSKKDPEILLNPQRALSVLKNHLGTGVPINEDVFAAARAHLFPTADSVSVPQPSPPKL